MRRYTPAEKGEALKRASEIGVAKTGQELGISIQTLYKWKNEAKENAALSGSIVGNGNVSEALKLLMKDDANAQRVKQLEAENQALKETCSGLKNVLAAIIQEM